MAEDLIARAHRLRNLCFEHEKARPDLERYAIVQWKPGLAMPWAPPDDVAVFLDWIDPPVRASEDQNHLLYGVEYDCWVGAFVVAGNYDAFVKLPCDSSRLELFDRFGGKFVPPAPPKEQRPAPQIRIPQPPPEPEPEPPPPPPMEELTYEPEPPQFQSRVPQSMEELERLAQAHAPLQAARRRPAVRKKPVRKPAVKRRVRKQ